MLLALSPVLGVWLWVFFLDPTFFWWMPILAVGAAVWVVAYSRWLHEVRVLPEGVEIYQRSFVYRNNLLRWEEIVGAEFKRMGLLPYVRVERRTGRRWWIPLYVKGEQDIRDALRSHAPEESPLQRCLSERPAARAAA